MMARGASETSVAVALAATVLLYCAAPSTTQMNCMPVLVSLSPCLDFIKGNTDPPPQACCTQLATIVKSDAQAQCLCTIINSGGAGYGMQVNKTHALTLPNACKVQTPPISECGASATTSPAATPSTPQPVPSSPPASASALAAASSPSESKAAPPADKSLAAMRSSSMFFPSVLIVLLVPSLSVF